MGGFSTTGVDGWLLLTLSVILRFPPSVGVGGIAGGGIAAEELAEGDMAVDAAENPIGGDIASGVETVFPK